MCDDMKVAAHPLVVAVALGLLAPDALEAHPVEKTSPSADCPDAHSHSRWEPAEPPSDEELHRVELEWLKTTSTT